DGGAQQLGVDCHMQRGGDWARRYGNFDLTERGCLRSGKLRSQRLAVELNRRRVLKPLPDASDAVTSCVVVLAVGRGEIGDDVRLDLLLDRVPSRLDRTDRLGETVLPLLERKKVPLQRADLYRCLHVFSTQLQDR